MRPVGRFLDIVAASHALCVFPSLNPGSDSVAVQMAQYDVVTIDDRAIQTYEQSLAQPPHPNPHFVRIIIPSIRTWTCIGSGINVVHGIKVLQHLIAKCDVVSRLTAKQSVLFCFYIRRLHLLSLLTLLPGNIPILPMPGSEVCELGIGLPTSSTDGRPFSTCGHARYDTY